MNKAYNSMIKRFGVVVNESLRLVKKIKPFNRRILNLLDSCTALLKHNDFISNISKLDMDNFENM